MAETGSCRDALHVVAGTAVAPDDDRQIAGQAPDGPGHAPDPHPAWGREWAELLAWVNGPGPGDRDCNDLPQYHRLLEIERRLAETPAATLAGVREQLRVVAYLVSQMDALPAMRRALKNALATVERLAAAQDGPDPGPAA